MGSVFDDAATTDPQVWEDFWASESQLGSVFDDAATSRARYW